MGWARAGVGDGMASTACSEHPMTDIRTTRLPGTTRERRRAFRTLYARYAGGSAGPCMAPREVMARHLATCARARTRLSLLKQRIPLMAGERDSARRLWRWSLQRGIDYRQSQHAPCFFCNGNGESQGSHQLEPVRCFSCRGTGRSHLDNQPPVRLP